MFFNIFYCFEWVFFGIFSLTLQHTALDQGLLYADANYEFGKGPANDSVGLIMLPISYPLSTIISAVYIRYWYLHLVLLARMNNLILGIHQVGIMAIFDKYAL